MLAALLADARPVALSGRELILQFPSDAAFLKRKAEQEDHRRIAAGALRSLTGWSLTLRFELGEEPSSEGGPAGPASEEELVKAFVDEFNAHEIADPAADDNEGDP
jgi:hypothetical protein